MLNDNLKTTLVSRFRSVRDLAQKHIDEFGEDSEITLNVTGRQGKAKRKKLLNRPKAPFGRILAEETRPHIVDEWITVYYCVCAFRASEVRDYMAMIVEANSGD